MWLESAWGNYGNSAQRNAINSMAVNHRDADRLVCAHTTTAQQTDLERLLTGDLLVLPELGVRQLVLEVLRLQLSEAAAANGYSY